MAYEVAFLVPDDLSLGAQLSIEHLMDHSGKAINCRFDDLDRYGEANLYVCCGISENPPDRYACLFWDDVDIPATRSSRKFLEAAIMTGFASPESMKQSLRFVKGAQWGCKPMPIPPAVDPELYTDQGTVRDGAMWVGSYRPLKGLRNAVEFAIENEMMLHIYGLGEPFLWVQNAAAWSDVQRYTVIHEEQPDLAMPYVYNRHQTLLSMPQWFDPCPRACIEATLCGCKVLVNDRNGFASWNYNEAGWRETMRALPKLFWAELLKRAAGKG